MCAHDDIGLGGKWNISATQYETYSDAGRNNYIMIDICSEALYRVTRRSTPSHIISATSARSRSLRKPDPTRYSVCTCNSQTHSLYSIGSWTLLKRTLCFNKRHRGSFQPVKSKLLSLSINCLQATLVAIKKLGKPVTVTKPLLIQFKKVHTPECFYMF